MSEQSAKIRLKVGSLEVDYEGESSFLKDGLLDLMRSTAALFEKHESALSEVLPSPDSDKAVDSSIPPDISIDTIASNMGAESGTELIWATAVYLRHVKKTKMFSGAEIRVAMKAAGYDRVRNPKQSFEKLVKDKKLVKKDGGRYALSLDEEKDSVKYLAE